MIRHEKSVRTPALWMIIVLGLGLSLAACSSDDEQPLPPGFTKSEIDFEVDDDGVQCPNAEYTSIQDAVDAAQPEQTIFVCGGTYAGTITVVAGKTGLTLLGVWRAPSTRRGDPDHEAIIDGSPAGQPGFLVQADSVAIIGFTIFNTDRTGIEVIAEDGVTPVNGGLVSGNRLDTTGDSSVNGEACAGGRGMNFEVAADIVLENNIVMNSCGAGIRLNTVTGGTVQNNEIDGSRKRPGIAIRGGSSGNMIASNISRNNRESGISLHDSTENTIRNNEMSGNGVPHAPLREIPGPGSNTDADDSTNPPLENPPQNIWEGNTCATANRDGLC